MHVGDTIFIFCLALIIFGPKKLPEIGRQIGKLMVEFRRASNEFKMQIDEELRAADEAERQKEITAASTMLPTAVPSPGLASGVAVGAAAPVIAPPITGLPVNHTFASTEEVPSPAMEAVQDAYPEAANGHDADFNPGLNTASNGVAAEMPFADASPFVTAEPVDGETTPHREEELTASEKARATLHHG